MTIIAKFGYKNRLEQQEADRKVFRRNPDLQKFARRPYPSEHGEAEREFMLDPGEEVVATLVTRTDDQEEPLRQFLIGPIRRGRRGGR